MSKLLGRHAIWIAALSVVSGLSASARAGVLYWDANGSSAGSSLNGGDWSTSAANWTTDSTGNSNTTFWINGSTAVFSAGTDHSTGAYGPDIVVTGTISTPKIIVEECSGFDRVTGGTISIGGGTIDGSAVSNFGDVPWFFMDSQLAGSGGLTLRGFNDTTDLSFFALTNTGNAYTGNTTITSGLVAYASDGSFGASGNIVLNGGGLIHSAYVNDGSALTRDIVIGAAGGTIRAVGKYTGVYSGAITGTGTLSLTGGGTTAFENAGYSGPIVVGDGTNATVLQIGIGGTIGSIGTATSVTFKSGAGLGISRDGNVDVSSILPANRTFAGNNIIEVNGPSGSVANIDIPFGTTTTYQGKLISRAGTTRISSGRNVYVNTVEWSGTDLENLATVEVGPGGSLNTKYLNIGSGIYQSGILNQTGGNVTVAAGGSGIRIGYWNNPGVASQINITGGTFDATGVANTAIGWDGAGSMTVGGGAGTATFTGANIQVDANGDTSAYADTLTVATNGIVQVTGNIIAPSVSGPDTVILSGGKIISTGSGTSTMSAPASVNVESMIEPAVGKLLNVTGLVSGSSVLNVGGLGTVSLNNASNSIRNVRVLAGATLMTTSTQTAAITAGGTLAGTGTFAGSLNITGTVSPGVNGVGTIKLGTTGVTTTTISGQGLFDLNGASTATGNDLATIFGNVTFGSGANVRPAFYGGTPAVGAAYTVFTYTGTRVGAPAIDPSLAATVRSSPAYHIDTATAGQVKLVVDSLGGGAAASLVWAGNGSANQWDLVGATNWLNGATADKFFNADSVTFSDAGSANSTVNLSGILSPASTTINTTQTYTFTGSGNISAGNLTKSGTGTLILSNTNSYTGLTSINGGTISVATYGALGAGNSSVSLNGGTLKTTASLSLSNPITIGAAGGTLDVASGTSITRVGSFTGGNLTKVGSGTLAFSGYSSGSFGGNSTLSVSGGVASFNTNQFNTPIGLNEIAINASGTVLCPSAVPFSLGGGFTTDPKININGGTLQIDREQYLSTITMTGGSITGASEFRTDYGFTLATLAAASPATISTRVSLVNTAFIANVADGAATNDLVVSGQIYNNPNGLAKSGAGRLVLNNASNNYGGATNVSGGTLEISGNYSPSGGVTSANTLGVTSGAFQISTTGSASYYSVSSPASDVTIDGTLTIQSSAASDISTFRKLAGAGKVTINKGTLNSVLGPRVATLALTSGAVAVINTTDADGAGPGIKGSSTGIARMNALFIDGTSKIDLKNNGLIIPSNGQINGSAISVNVLRSILLAGRGGPGTGNARWNLAGGIGTSSFTFDETVSSIGYVWTGDPHLLVPPTNVNGENYVTGDYLVKYCAAADADLNGLVDDADVSVIGLTYDNGATTGHHWYEGDFNYDGRINDDDVSTLGLAYNSSGSPLSPTFYAALSADYSASFASAFAAGASGTLVPEPATLGLLSISALGLLRRRRN